MTLWFLTYALVIPLGLLAINLYTNWAGILGTILVLLFIGVAFALTAFNETA